MRAAVVAATVVAAGHLMDRNREPERGSEREPIKILLERDAFSNKTNTGNPQTSPTCTTQVCQDHIVTGVLLILRTNNHRSYSRT
jgi:hypothetical protein